MVVATVAIILLGLAVSPAHCDAETPLGNSPPNKVAPAAQPAKPKPLTPEQQERLREAEQLGKKVVQLYQAGRPRGALPLAQEALKIRQQILGLEHRDVALSLEILGLQYVATGEYAKAEPLLRRASEIQKKVLGENHPDYATSLNNLAELYRAQGHDVRAEPLCARHRRYGRKSWARTTPIMPPA